MKLLGVAALLSLPMLTGCTNEQFSECETGTNSLEKTVRVYLEAVAEDDLQKACAVSVAAAPEYANVKFDEIRTQVLAYGDPKDFEVIEDPDSIMGHGSVAEILLDGTLIYRLPIYSFGDLYFVDRAVPSGEYTPADDPY